MCYIFVDQNLISGRSPQVVKTKTTRSAAVISFQVVSRRDGCSKAHSQRIWYSIFYYKNLYFWVPPATEVCHTVLGGSWLFVARPWGPGGGWTEFVIRLITPGVIIMECRVSL